MVVTAVRPGIVVHTGAGNFTLASLGERQAPMKDAVTAALTAGHTVIAAGGTSLDAVQAAIVVLEDSPFFNAGKGAVFTHDGKNELDASIMDGATQRAGAVAGLRHIKNPILLARLVMEKSPHVMMVGEGAEAFAKEQGNIEFVPEDYFYTEPRWQELRARSSKRSNHADRRSPCRRRAATSAPWARSRSTGTAISPRRRRRAAW